MVSYTKEKTIWYSYHDVDITFELPIKFRFASINTEANSMTNFGEAITPGILPVNFSARRSQQPSYEFYYPSAAACQLGFGQLPVRPFFAHFVKPRETLNNSLEHDQLKNLVPDHKTVDLDGWIISSFTSRPFKEWLLPHVIVGERTPRTP